MKSCLLILLAFATTTAFSQGFYVKLGGGYSLPMGSSKLYEPTTAETISGNVDSTTTTTKAVKGSYGTGSTVSASLGYKLSPFIGLDLNLAYSFGKRYSGVLAANAPGFEVRLSESTQSKGIFISPTILFMAGTDNVRPYAMMGITMGLIKLKGESLGYIDVSDIPSQIEIIEETRGDMAFGVRGGIGVDVNLSSRFSLFAEAVYSGISYYAKEKEMVKATQDGVDILGQLQESERRTIYVDQITIIDVNGTPTTDPKQPTQELREPLPLSNLNISAGVKVKLGSD